MTAKKVRPEPHEALIGFLTTTTSRIAAIYAEQAKPTAAVKLTEKAQKLQDLINNQGFGCYGEKVAEAFSILTGETIKPKAESPRLDREHGRTVGLCIILKLDDYPLSAGQVYIRVPNGWMRADTGGVKDGSVTPTLSRFTFAEPKAIKEALKKMPVEKRNLLTLALL